MRGGSFPHHPPTEFERVNRSGPPVPKALSVAGTSAVMPLRVVQHPPTGVQKAPIGDPQGVVFTKNDRVTINADKLAEPSGASSGDVVFVSFNWGAAYSTNGGTTFTTLDPNKIFPSDSVGFCCDQIVQYVPRIDRFIWLLLGPGGLRLASASPADISKSHGTAWTYWNLTPGLFGFSSGFDLPDLAVGDNYLYINAVNNPGKWVARVALSEIQAGGTITIGFTDPTLTQGYQLMQNTGDEIFWAYHQDNSTIRVYSWAEGANTYFWRDIGIAKWANYPFGVIGSTTPDGQNWLNRSAHDILGATRSSNQLWFAWTAGADNNFPQPHVEMVTLDRSKNFSVIQQVQIWNDSYAFGYPALATNKCTGEIGLSLLYGGGGNYENHVVGFWGDFMVYITTSSNVGTDAYGDYVTIRQQPASNADPGNLFDAFGNGINTIGNNKQGDVRYVSFGRPPSTCVPHLSVRLFSEKDETGNGTVTSSPNGINCGPTCDATFDPGTVVTLTASPDSSSKFDRWSGACHGTSPVTNVTVNWWGDATCVATFAGPPTLASIAGQWGHDCGPLPCFTVVNIGDGPVENMVLRFVLSADAQLHESDLVLQTVNMSSIEAGQTQTHGLSGTLPAERNYKGQYVLAVIDFVNTGGSQTRRERWCPSGRCAERMPPGRLRHRSLRRPKWSCREDRTQAQRGKGMVRRVESG